MSKAEEWRSQVEERAKAAARESTAHVEERAQFAAREFVATLDRENLTTDYKKTLSYVFATGYLSGATAEHESLREEMEIALNEFEAYMTSLEAELERTRSTA